MLACAAHWITVSSKAKGLVEAAHGRWRWGWSSSFTGLVGSMDETNDTQTGCQPKLYQWKIGSVRWLPLLCGPYYILLYLHVCSMSEKNSCSVCSVLHVPASSTSELMSWKVPLVTVAWSDTRLQRSRTVHHRWDNRPVEFVDSWLSWLMFVGHVLATVSHSDSL